MKKKKAKAKAKTRARAGWAFPINTTRAHFFIGGSALCGDCDGYVGPKDTSMAPTRDDCARCRKLIDAIVRLSKAA